MSAALANIVVQLGLSLATTYSFYQIDKTAGQLMIPLQVSAYRRPQHTTPTSCIIYLTRSFILFRQIWISTALCINWSLVQNNPEHDGKID
jgi:tryptophan-rich sensory protein